MSDLNEQAVYCPYCGESISVLINSEDVGDQYIEDCQVCCRPIVFRITESFDGELCVSVHDENDAV